VALNNIVVMKQDHDLFDSFKKLKQATSQVVGQKLTTTQKKALGFNRCLLLLHMNKMDECRDMVKQLQESFPNSDALALIQASLLMKEKKNAKAEEFLNNFATQNPNDSLRVQLSLAQLHLNKGDIKSTIQVLESISQLKNKPGFVNTLVTLYEQIHDIDGALRTLDQYADWWTSQKQRNEEDYIRILKENANFKLKLRRYKEAAQMFEQVIKLSSNDLESLPGLVIASSQFDPTLAEKYDSRIPQMPSLVVSEKEAETLENLSAPRVGTKEKEKVATLSDVDDKKLKKKKKKRKIRLPKNFELIKGITPDPERWIPLRERSTFKKRTRKGKLEKGGSQGAAPLKEKAPEKGKAEVKPASSTPTSASTPTTASATPGTPTPATTQQKQQKQQQQQKKKKGKRR